MHQPHHTPPGATTYRHRAPDPLVTQKNLRKAVAAIVETMQRIVDTTGLAEDTPARLLIEQIQFHAEAIRHPESATAHFLAGWGPWEHLATLWTLLDSLDRRKTHLEQTGQLIPVTEFPQSLPQYQRLSA